jgi:hypothetical protein
MAKRAEKPKTRTRRGRPTAADPSTALRGVLGELAALTPDRAPHLFPRGIDHVHVNVHADGRMEVEVAGPSRHAAGAPAAAAADDLRIGDKVPDKAERDVVGAAASVIKRGTPEFLALTRNGNVDVVFKDEEGTGADRMMTSRLSASIDALAALVKGEWPESRLRVTEAWDENMEHGTRSVHYEARAADLTTSPVDGRKLGRLARLAVTAGFDWVFYENALHVHVSMAK